MTIESNSSIIVGQMRAIRNFDRGGRDMAWRWLQRRLSARLRGIVIGKALNSVVGVAVVGLLLAGCGGSTHRGSTVTESPTADTTVGQEVKKHIEALNPSEHVGIRSVSCEERGPVPSMGRDAVAYLCSIHSEDGETTKPQLWAYLPMDEEEPVQTLDTTAERELASRGESAGLNDGHSEADNRGAEEDIRKAEETVRETDGNG